MAALPNPRAFHFTRFYEFSSYLFTRQGMGRDMETVLAKKGFDVRPYQHSGLRTIGVQLHFGTHLVNLPLFRFSSDDQFFVYDLPRTPSILALLSWNTRQIWVLFNWFAWEQAVRSVCGNNLFLWGKYHKFMGRCALGEQDWG